MATPPVQGDVSRTQLLLLLTLLPLGSARAAHADRPLPVADAPCEIRAPRGSIAQVTVAPQGDSAFSLELSQLPLRVEPQGDKSRVRVLSPLVFDAEVPTDKVELRSSQRIRLYDGRLIIAKGVQPLAWKESGSDAAEGVFAATLPHLKIDVGGPLLLPCSALTVAPDNSPPKVGYRRYPAREIDFVESSEAFELYRAPNKGSPLRVRSGKPLEVIAKKKDWLQVRARWSDGSKLQGWIPRGEHEIAHNLILESGIGLGTLGTHGCGRSHPPQLHEFDLIPNAPIHTSAEGPVWAHTAKRLTVQAFALRRSDGWIQIGKIAGLPPEPCSEHQKMWVHANHVIWKAKKRK